MKSHFCKDCNLPFESFGQFMKHRKSDHKKSKATEITEPPLNNFSLKKTTTDATQEFITTETKILTNDTEPQEVIPTPPTDSLTAEEVNKNTRTNSDRLRDAFNSIRDADARAAIGRVLAHPQCDLLSVPEIFDLTFREVIDGDGRAAVYRQFQ